MPARLKVFETQIGVNIWVVAASSQKAALQAWDVRENLFAHGAAKETKDPAAIALALRTLGKPAILRTIALPALENVARLDVHRLRQATKAKKSSAPDRTQLDAAERAMQDFKEMAKRQRAALEQRALALKREIAANEERLAVQEKVLTARLARERSAFKKASE